ncbi:hypothetical protein G6F56_007612 [Rhizopus delemar]|nr:hypothetical protein G6F56_007612 [Rhizopus delemar]
MFDVQSLSHSDFMYKPNPKQEFESSKTPFIVSSSLFSDISDYNDSSVSLHPYYLSPCVAPQFYLDQDHTDHIENKLLNDVFFSPAMLSPGKDDVSAFTEFSYERTSSICSSNSGSTTEDEDYNVQEDNLFLCDLDFETKEETFTSIKRSINNPTDDGTALASPLKRRKREKKADDSDKVHSSKLSKTADSSSPTIYQMFSKQNIDWCRYCGTTEGINWRPGPWGKRTLCNKHGCDYKGYGFACKLPRLDLTEYLKEPITKRIRPVLQHYCSACQKKETAESKLIVCDGCPKAFHSTCLQKETASTPWYCTDTCGDNLKRKRVVVELPRKRLPLMRTPKSALLQ